MRNQDPDTQTGKGVTCAYKQGDGGVGRGGEQKAGQETRDAILEKGTQELKDGEEVAGSRGGSLLGREVTGCGQAPGPDHRWSHSPQWTGKCSFFCFPRFCCIAQSR